MAKHMRKTKPEWTDNAVQEAVRSVKEKVLSVRRAAGAFNVPFSCRQKIIQGIKMNKCVKEVRLFFHVNRINSLWTDVRRADYSVAVTNNVKHKFSSRKQMAGKYI
jgi:hypothetical protein